MMNEIILSYEQIKNIFNDTYNLFYLKWKDIKTEEEISAMWEKAKEINRKHNDCKLCRDIMLFLCNNIELDLKQREVRDNGE
jgi:hypothetical protein